MFGILLKQFLGNKTTIIAFFTLITIGVISIGLGNHFLNKQKTEINQIAPYQKKNHKTNASHFPNELAYALYYQKFAYINPLSPISSLSIGQRDVNTNILNIGILALEGQKYDTDLVNPVKQQIGNLDLSFVIIFIFPLVIIALSFNLLSEEKERGIWKLIRVQGESPTKFLLSKLGVRILFIVSILLVLFCISVIWGKIPLDTDLIYFMGISILYLIFWFGLALLVVSFQKNSNTNAIILIMIWVIQVMVLPMIISNYSNHKYPIKDALSLSISQRDNYHKKWDVDKKPTMDKFYKKYPQYSHYGYPKDGFTWEWYYAMHYLGDEESQADQNALFEKVKKRQALTKRLSIFCPPLNAQLAMNRLSNSGLDNYLSFLSGATLFHEKLRLSFYDKIFQEKGSDSVDWEIYKPEYHIDNTDKKTNSSIFILFIFIIISIITGVFKLNKI